MRHVLILGQDLYVRDIIESGFDEEGTFRVLVATDVTTATLVVLNKSPDVIVIHTKFEEKHNPYAPGFADMIGALFAGYLRAAGDETPIILVSEWMHEPVRPLEEKVAHHRFEVSGLNVETIKGDIVAKARELCGI